MVSGPFSIGRSTRQGCPLSPLLFALTLEHLAQKIREDTQITGLLVGGTEHKILMYADDILLYLSKPKTSLSTLLSVIDTFSQLSGSKINWTKSEVLPISNLNSPPSGSYLPFKINSKIKYLGIVTDGDLNNLVKLNYIPLMEKISKDIQ